MPSLEILFRSLTSYAYQIHIMGRAASISLMMNDYQVPIRSIYKPLNGSTGARSL